MKSNMNIIRSILRVLLIFSTFVFNVIASENQAVNISPNKGFRVTLFNKWGGPQLHILEKQTYVPLRVHKSAYTRIIPFQKDNSIILYSKVDGKKGHEGYKPFLRVHVPDSINEPLLLLNWNSKDQKVEERIIEFSPRKFKYGTYQIVNLSDTPISGAIGAQYNSYTCEAQSSYISNFDIKEGAKIPITAYAKKTEVNLSLVYSVPTIHRHRKRVIFFLKPERNKTGHLTCKAQSVVDFVKTEKPIRN